MGTEQRDRVLELWPPIGAMADQFVTRSTHLSYDREIILRASHALLHRIIAGVAFDLARFADTGIFLRPDLAAELCFHLQQFPTLLTDTFGDGESRIAVINVEQWMCFRGLLGHYARSSASVLSGEIRTPWNDDDFRLFAGRIVEFVDNALHAYLS